MMNNHRSWFCSCDLNFPSWFSPIWIPGPQNTVTAIGGGTSFHSFPVETQTLNPSLFSLRESLLEWRERTCGMPYVDIYSKDDYASIFYTTNTEYDSVGGFDPGRPTIIMLHPTFLDSSWLSEQFADPRLENHFNLIAFDMRVCGKSMCRTNGKHDSWVEAADVAMCSQVRSWSIKFFSSSDSCYFKTLQLPPCHVLACEYLAVNCALRFAILWVSNSPFLQP